MQQSLKANRYQWHIKPPPPDGFVIDLSGVSPFLGHGHLIRSLLYHRGIQTKMAAKSFFDLNLSTLSDPFLLPDMESAVSRIIQSINESAPIGIFGDFDVDGLSGTAIVVRTIEALGGIALPYIPNRELDGHGLSENAIESFSRSNVDLIITVDTGTTAISEVELAKQLSIDVIITDHHLMGEDRPKSVALVNPQVDNQNAIPLAGAGVAFKLAQALWETIGLDWPFDLLALASLGTIADLAPLKDENRTIVAQGLAELGRTHHPGLQALMQISKPQGYYGKPDTDLVSFYLSPRLNAPGRLGDAEPSLRILTTNDAAEARTLATRLDYANKERRRLSEKAWMEAQSQFDQIKSDASLLTVRCNTVPVGILGPLASRVADVYGIPTVAYSVVDGMVRASIRSIDDFDVHAALSASSHKLDRFGGHAMAAGFTVSPDKMELVINDLEQHAEGSLMGKHSTKILEIDLEVPVEDIEYTMWDSVQSMEPCGVGNKKPVFLSRRVKPIRFRTMGKDQRHIRMTVNGKTSEIEAIGFGIGPHIETNEQGYIDAVYELHTNMWKGRKQRELRLIDTRPSVV